MNIRTRSPRSWTLVVAVALSVVSSPVLLDQAAQAAGSGVSINELMYNPVSDNDGDEFVELANTTAAAVDLSGWCFTSGITLCFPPGTSIAANGYLVIGEDAARFQATYGFAPAAVYTGKLSNSGEKVTLSDSAGTRDGHRDVQRPRPVADHAGRHRSVPGADRPGAGPQRPAELDRLHGGLRHHDPRPQLGDPHRASSRGSRRVSATPQLPAANQAVTVAATVTGQSGAVTLFYRTDFGAEQSIGHDVDGRRTASRRASRVWRPAT